MKKLILLFFVCMFLVSLGSFVLGEEKCQVAYPMMEVLKCEKQDSFTKTLPFSCSGTTCTLNYNCISDCIIDTIHIDCGATGGIKGDVTIAGGPPQHFGRFYEISGKHDLNNFKTAGEGEEILINANCDFAWIDYALNTSKSYVTIKDSNKYLYATNHEWSSHKLDDTPNCIPQSRVSNFISKQVSNGNLPSVYQNGGTDILGNQIITQQGDYSLSNINLNSELRTGDTLSYFYRWELVSNINLKYDQDKNPVYCGGSSDQRKLINYEQVGTGDGSCYLVPSSLKRNVECCLDGDCHLNNLLCGPDFICTDKKPCNGVYDCGTEETSCINNQKTTWTCDTSSGEVNMPDGTTYKGWCKKETKSTQCCSSSCQEGYHCVEDKGCESDVRIINCPAGKCCKSGGDYREAICQGGNICCTNGGYVGDCKKSCEEIKESTSTKSQDASQTSGITGNVAGNGGSSKTGILIAIVFLILIGGSIAFYIYKRKSPSKVSSPSTTSHCTKCGSKISGKFCTKCGKKG